MKISQAWNHLVLISAGLVAVAVASTGRTVELTFTLDDTLSHMSLAGSFLDVPLLEQHEDSLDTTYSGTITAEVDDPFDPTTITISGANMVAAISDEMALPEAGGGPEAGDPGTPEPGMYSMYIDGGFLGLAYATAREVSYTMTTSDPNDVDILVPETITGGMFAANQTLTNLSGFFDTNLAPNLGGDFGRDDLTGDPAPSMSMDMSSYIVDGTTATLTIPYLLSGGDPGEFVLTFDGIFIATVDLGPGRQEADFNDDGIVNGDDFLIWQTGFDQFDGDATQEDGDATIDGLVDGDDFLVWQQQFTPGEGAASAVPEPAALGLGIALVLGLAGLRMCFRRP